MFMLVKLNEFATCQNDGEVLLQDCIKHPLMNKINHLCMTSH